MSFGKDRTWNRAGRDFPQAERSSRIEDPDMPGSTLQDTMRIPQGILQEERLFWMDMSPDRGRFAYSDREDVLQ